MVIKAAEDTATVFEKKPDDTSVVKYGSCMQLKYFQDFNFQMHECGEAIIAGVVIHASDGK